VRVLSESDVRQHLDALSLIAALETAFRDRYLDFSIPTRVQMKLADGILLIMPCYDRAGCSLGMKLVSVRGEEVPPQDRIHATVMLMDPVTGQPRLWMAANYLTDLRTAATSALATRVLAREDAKTLGIFGTGRQAWAHLKVLPLVRKFDRALVCARDHERLIAFCEQMSHEIGFPVEAADANRCAAESDVLCTCTNARAPLFDGKLLRAGTHLNLVGAFQPHTREVDSVVVRGATVVVDTYDAAFAEAGDVLIPMQEGVIDRDHIKMNLHELVSVKNFGRSFAEITVFKSVGCALEDLVAAELVAKSFAAG
jgi:ornithine cyclodeaminase/alanine dehydrogenase-like protein (mu-crystallin family)